MTHSQFFNSIVPVPKRHLDLTTTYYMYLPLSLAKTGYSTVIRVKFIVRNRDHIQERQERSTESSLDSLPLENSYVETTVLKNTIHPKAILDVYYQY